MGDGLGNVIQSRGFQFTEIPVAHSSIVGELIWTPRLPKTPTLIKDRWIYAFQFSSDGQKAILAAEYHADEAGTLTFMDGKKRRTVEPPAAPKPTRVPEAGLPLVFQGDAVKYAFVVTRGPLGKAAIWMMEDRLHPIFQRFNLADSSAFLTGSNNKSFVPVIDLLTILAGLHHEYEVALNEAINYTTVHPKNPHNADVEVRGRKYQLAKLIESSLLSSEPGGADPMNIAKHLAGGGSKLRNFIEDHESKVRKLRFSSENAATELIRFLRSLAVLAGEWYAGTPQARSSIGHFWVDALGRALDRLNETSNGRDFERELVQEEQKGLLSLFFAPDEDADDDVDELFHTWFPVARKAVTGVVIAVAELAPALIVYGKVRAASMRKIAATLRGYLVHTDIKIVTGPMRGRVTALIGVTVTSVHIELKVSEAKADIAKWLEEGKPHWPEETRWAKRAEVLGRLLMGIELINLCCSFVELKNRPSGRRLVEFSGALMDMAVALEDPIRAKAKSFDASRAARGGESAVDADAAVADASAGESEAVGTWGRAAGPAIFKWIGVVSAAIDLYMNVTEGQKAAAHGNIDLAHAHYAVAGGSGLIAVASITNGFGYYAEAAALTAVSSALLVVGVAILIAGYLMKAYFDVSSWQEFASHCEFGNTPAAPGKRIWSNGNFSRWTSTRKGLDLQTQVLTGMLCSFQISGAFKLTGHGSDAETISIIFGALPPASKLVLKFTVTFTSNVVHRPAYIVDLETLKIIETGGGANAAADFKTYDQDGRLHHLVLTAERPASLASAKISSSTCSVQIHYGTQHVSLTAGDDEGSESDSDRLVPTIPVGKPRKYRIYDGSTVNYRDKSSLGDDDDEEEQEEEDDKEEERRKRASGAAD